MILITGASGNVGREVLAQIGLTGSKVRAAFQSPPKRALPNGMEAVRVDYNEPDTLRNALKGVEAMFLVGPPSRDLLCLERNAADVMAESGVKRVVKLSAMGGREAIFPRQHAESEDYIRSKGLPYTFLRPNGFMQNLVNYNSATIRSMGKFFGSEGEGKISFIDVRDVAAVAVRTLTEDGHIGKEYTLTGPEALSNRQVGRILTEVMGRAIEFVNLPPDDLESALLAAGVPAWNASALIDLQRLYRAGKASQVTGDVGEILGRAARNLRDFIVDHRNAFEPAEVAAD